MSTGEKFKLTHYPTFGRWMWRDKDANFHDAPSLREAIAAVLIRDPVETHEP